MARDRQRAKRRRAQRNAARPNPRSSRDVEREIGLGSDDDDDVVETPLGEGTAAPDPLLHSSADVDEARLAEAGALHPEPSATRTLPPGSTRTS